MYLYDYLQQSIESLVCLPSRSSDPDGDRHLFDRVLIYHMSKLSILRILPLLTLTIPLAAVARDASSIVPMTLGQQYTGLLTRSPSNPQGEVCYGLSVEPDTRITLKVKTGGVGILKFAVYDKTKGLQFFHNDVSNKPQADGDTSADSRFSFPAVSEVSKLCLTTTNLDRGQQYNITVTGKPGRKSKSRIALRPVTVNGLTIGRTKTKLSADLPAPKPPTVPAVQIAPPPPPTGEPYCYVGTWQITDLSGYWLPTIQNFTQATITDPLMLGYAKVTLHKDGNAVFEALDLEQKYTLKSQDTGAKIEKIGLSLAGTSTARFQVNADSTLTFSSQSDRRMTTKLNLGASLKLTGDRLFLLFGDRDLPPVKLPYKCLDRDNLILRVPLPTGQKLIPISLKRVG